MSKIAETGVFNRPDPVTKNLLFAEDRDTIEQLKRKLSVSERNNKFMAIAVIACVIVGGFGVWKSDTRYYMVERTPDHRKIVYVADPKSIPVNETIKRELIDFTYNSRSIFTDNRANLERRRDALKMLQASADEKEALYKQAEEELKELHKNVSVAVVVEEPVNVGGEQWTVRWKEAQKDRRTGRMQEKTYENTVIAVYVEQDKENPAGVLFSKPITISGAEAEEVK